MGGMLTKRKDSRLLLYGSFLVLGLVMTGGIGISTLAQDASSESARVMRGHRGSVTSICFSPDGRWLASGGWDQTIRIWDVSTGRQERKLDDHSGEVFSVVFSPDGRFLASCGFDRKIMVWEVSSWNLRHKLRLDTYATAIDISSDGSVAVGTRDGDITLSDIETGETLRAWKNKLPEYDRVFPVWSLDFSPDSRYLATAGPIILWDAGAGNQAKTQLRPGAVHALAFSPDGRILASAHWGGMARLWDVETEKLLHSLESETEIAVPGPCGAEQISVLLPLAAVAFSPDGIFVATGGADKRIRIWEVSSGQIVKSLQGHTKSVVGLCYSPDRKYLASASLDGTIRLWLN